MSLLRDGAHIKGILTFRKWGAGGQQLPLWKETPLGRFKRKALLSLHKNDVAFDNDDFDLWLWSKRAFGLWTLEGIRETNLLVTAGMAVMASRLNGSGAEAAVTFLEIGTGSTPAVIGNTLLETPITGEGMPRGAATVSIETTTTARLDLTFGPNTTSQKIVREAGDFNNATVNTIDMLARSVFAAKTVEISESLQVTYDHEIT